MPDDARIWGVAVLVNSTCRLPLARLDDMLILYLRGEKTTMDSRDMQVIGLCRFSYPALGGFQVEHDTPNDRSAFLYARDRIEERFATFETFTLPPLRAQTDGDFTFLVVIGDDFPTVYHGRLMDLLRDIPQAVVQAHAPGPHRAVMKQAINSVRDDRKLPCFQFRMDDDDAVSVTFIERLREAAQDCRPLLRKNKHVAIDFNQGWIARPSKTGIDACPTVEPLWTAGLAMSSKPSAANTIMNFGHSKLARFMPVVSFTGEDMFIRGHNDFNDSRQTGRVRKVDLVSLSSEQDALFRQTYNICSDHVRRVFSD